MSNRPYPEVKYVSQKVYRIKNVAQEVYLCVKTDSETDKPKIATKTLQMGQFADSELDFYLYYYETAHPGQTIMVLLFHEATGVCFSMSDDKKLQISGLHRETPVETPMGFTVADERFFYYKNADNNTIALQATSENDTDSNYYLAVDENNDVTILQNTDELISDNLRFYLEDLNDINNINEIRYA